MKDYGRVKGDTYPQEIVITPTEVIIASDIQPYEEELDECIMSGYEYNYKVYSKDEYLLLNMNSLKSLEEELSAAKVLLGLEE